MSTTTPVRQVDPRALRFAAALSAGVLAAVILTASVWLLAFQVVVFAIATVFGLRASPYGVLYARLVRPLLGLRRELEDAAPPRFAQLVGLVVSLGGLAAYLSGAVVVGHVVVGLALAAAFLNAAFGFCLGCEIYLAYRRLFPSRSIPKTEVTP